MARIDPKSRTIEAKIVYYGTALGGKTTNLRVLHGLNDDDERQKLVSINTAGDRTLFFDLLRFELGKILDWRIKLKLYTVPGQAEYNETRRVVLAGTDAVVFVADSAPDRKDENIRSVNFLRLNLKQNGLDPDTLPIVLQYNKRDLPDAMTSGELQGDLNWRQLPYFMSTAIQAKNVIETFEEAACQLAKRIIMNYSRARVGSADEDVRYAVREQLASLYQRQPTFALDAADDRHMVVTSDSSNVRPGREAMETPDLLRSAIETEMIFLNEMLERDDEATQPVSDARSLDLTSLAAAHQAAARSRRLKDTATPFLQLACTTAGVDRGSVLLLTPGDGTLVETAVANIAQDPLNQPPALGGAPATRALARGPAPLYHTELARQTIGSAIQSAAAPVPFAAIPLNALERKVGLLMLYAPGGVGAPSAVTRQALETIANALAMALAVRGLERLLDTRSPVATGQPAMAAG